MRISPILATAFLLAALAIPAAALEPNTSCQALEAWASQLQHLPTDYESFSELTTAERKAVYDRLSSAERAALWHHHWQEALRAGDWTQKQKALIEEAAGLMQEETFVALKLRQGVFHDSARTAVRDFEARVKKAFLKAEAAAIFYRLGTAPAAAPEAGGLFSYCDCSPGGEECGTSLCWPSRCPFRATGCGIIYEEPCTRQCQY